MTVLVQVECPFCHGIDLVEAPMEGYVAWMGGAYIQDALPGLSPAQRELLMSGICDACFPKGEEVA
jgi:hypothetical protein